MKFVFAPLAAAVLFVTSALAQQLTINTPTNPVVCQPLLLTWSGGVAPYFLSILPGNQPNAAALHDFGQVTGTSLTWTVNIAAGTSIGLTLRDSSGATAQSAPFTPNAGSDSSCVGKDPSSSPGGPSSTPSTTGGGGTTSSTSTPSTTGAPTPTTTPTTPTTTPATSTTPAPTTRPSTTGTSTTGGGSTTSSNAAPTQGVTFGAAGMIGAAVIALLA